MLSTGDVFIVDNFTIYSQGNNIGLEETLMDMLVITLLRLPAYHPEFNPTELVFQLLFQQMRSNRARYGALSEAVFKLQIINEMSSFNLLDIVKN